MTKRTKALQFSKKVMLQIAERDRQCIFCHMDYHMDSHNEFEYSIQQIAHYINKSQGGLGIVENGVLICQYHHHLLDNGNKGFREEMIKIIEEYLKGIYLEWNKENLKFSKYI